MICPYCDKEMTPGFIYGAAYGANHSFKWLPESKKPTLENLQLDGVAIGEHSALSEPKIKCFRCCSCKKVIIDMHK